MAERNEINALFQLMDDPDTDVYTSVCERISSHWGCSLIPHLENLWETTIDEFVQGRIEMLIHRLQYELLQKDFQQWKASPYKSLLEGALLTARYCYPDMKAEDVRLEIKRINQTIWLELNDYLTPLEQFHILNSIIYHFYKLKGAAYELTNPNDFLINKVLETKQGNAFSNGVLFQILAESFNIPIYALNVPQHYLLGFFRKERSFFPKGAIIDRKEILFFIDATSGQSYSPQDLLSYLEKAGIGISEKIFQPLTHTQIIAKLLLQVSKCFDGSPLNYKSEELIDLSHIIINK